MSPVPLLSSTDSAAEIRSYFEWHQENQHPLLLMCAASDGPVSALVQGIDAANANVVVLCLGLNACEGDANVPYAVIGRSPLGANFLASGQMGALPGAPDRFVLSFPQWIDVSQSRESYRFLAPVGHFLHFSAADPHLNDLVCRVHNISQGGLAVEWHHDLGVPLELNSVTDTAILHARHNKVHLGSLRVAHISPLERGCIIGLDFEQAIPRSFDALVQDAQRAEYLAHTDSQTV